MSMKELPTSKDTQALLAQVKEIYGAKKLFAVPDKPELRRSPELDDLFDRAAQAMARDLAAHAKISGSGAVWWHVLHNAVVLVFRQVLCTVYVGVHNYDTGQSYSLGSYRVKGCSAA